MHDLVIRGGVVVDGTGAPRRTADVAIDGGLVAEVGKVSARGRREIDADGLLVTPGWVDIHTHYDGQATWDPQMTPSSWHGVTTAVFGNCGVGFAPVRPGAEKYLINLMEGVEDIPEIVLSEGLDFRWESFGEYLDVLAETPRVMDIGAQVPHAALRFYVMGDRGADHAQAPTAEEAARMGVLLEQALRAGALGFTTSRTKKHRAADGRPTPSLSARDPELMALAGAMRRASAGVLEVNSDFADDDFDVLRAAAEAAGRPLSCLIVQIEAAPDRWRDTMRRIERARAAGIEATGQVGCRGIGVLMGLETTINPFAPHPLWKSLRTLSRQEKLAALRSDAELRRRLIEEPDGERHPLSSPDMLKRAFEMTDAVDYEPGPEQSIAARAAATGVDPRALALELMMQDEGRRLLMHPLENYSGGDLGAVREMLEHPYSVCGVADAGAHVGIISDASSPTYLLTHWARDRRRGPKLDLEFVVRKQTRDTAAHYGLNDRGVLAPGYRADVNVIDFENLRIAAPEMVYDLPAGGKRLVQRAHGYRHTLVAGVETRQGDEATGATPGRLVRGAQAAPR